jgi:capreomycidine synthase
VTEPEPYLEAWYRSHLPSAEIDISSSGVEPYTFEEVRRLAGIRSDELDAILLNDSLTLGATPLRKAIAARYAAGDTSRVLVTHGSSEAIFLVLGALLGPGNRVCVLAPIYHSLRRYVELSGAGMSEIQLHDVVESYCDWRELLPEGTRCVVVNFPHNPTGYAPTPEGMQGLRGRCAEIGAWLVWDAAFEELQMSQTSVRLTYEPGERVVRFGTFSKAFGLPGLRVGWCIAPPEILELTLPIRDRTTLFLSPLVEAIATKVVQAADAFVGHRAQQARHNLRLVDSWIESEGEQLSWMRPHGGVCGLIRLAGVQDTESFCMELLHRHGTLLVPGRAFDEPDAVRLGFGGSTQSLVAGLGRVSELLHSPR